MLLPPGYKQDQASLKAFPELLIHRMENQQIPTRSQSQVRTMLEIGAINTGVYVHETIPDFSQGSLQQTDMTTDMALVQTETPDENGSIFLRSKMVMEMFAIRETVTLPLMVKGT